MFTEKRQTDDVCVGSPPFQKHFSRPTHPIDFHENLIPGEIGTLRTQCIQLAVTKTPEYSFDPAGRDLPPIRYGFHVFLPLRLVTAV
jgi:hypothetical protein